MESGSWRDCCKSGVNPSTPFTGINPDQNWIDDDWILNPVFSVRYFAFFPEERMPNTNVQFLSTVRVRRSVDASWWN